MPRFLEDKLRAEAASKGFKGKRADKYVYGTLQNLNAMSGNKETAKGRAMQAKHEATVRQTHNAIHPGTHAVTNRAAWSAKPSERRVTGADAYGATPHPLRNLAHYAHPPKGR